MHCRVRKTSKCSKPSTTPSVAVHKHATPLRCDAQPSPTFTFELDGWLCRCELLHPGLSCNSHYVNYFFTHLTTFSLRFYLPLNVISTLIFNRKRLVEEPKKTTTRMARSVTRSACFLSLYCANALVSIHLHAYYLWYMASISGIWPALVIRDAGTSV